MAVIESLLKNHVQLNGAQRHKLSKLFSCTFEAVAGHVRRQNGENQAGANQAILALRMAMALPIVDPYNPHGVPNTIKELLEVHCRALGDSYRCSIFSEVYGHPNPHNQVGEGRPARMPHLKELYGYTKKAMCDVFAGVPTSYFPEPINPDNLIVTLPVHRGLAERLAGGGEPYLLPPQCQTRFERRLQVVK